MRKFAFLRENQAIYECPMTYRTFWGAKMGKFLGILFLIMLVVPLHLQRLSNILKYLIFQIWGISQIHTRFWGFSQI